MSSLSENAAATVPSVRETDPNDLTVLQVVIIALGTLGAISVLPDNISESTSLVLSALVLCISLTAGPLLLAGRQPKALLRIEILLILSPIYWLLAELIQGLYELGDVSRASIESAFLTIGSFCIAVLIGAYHCKWRLPNSVLKIASAERSPDQLLGLGTVAFVLAFLRFAIPANFDVGEMIDGLRASRWSAPWSRGALGGWDAFLDQFQYFGYILPCLTVMLAGRVGWKNGRTVLCSLYTIVISAFLAQGGGRRIIGAIVGMAVVVWVIPQTKIRFVKAATLIALLIVLLVGLEFVLDYRNEGFAGFTEKADYERSEVKGVVRVDNNFYTLAQTIELIPRYYPHVYLQYPYYIFVRPIPRVLWPDKPTDFGFDLVSALGMTGLTLSMSVIGELYMAAGYFGVVLGGIFYGRIAGMANNLLAQRATYETAVIYGVVAMSLFLGMRSMIELMLVNYALIGWLLLVRLSLLFSEKGRARTKIVDCPL